MDDVTTYALVTASFFLAALAFGLLSKYRQVSQRISLSTDLGHDLWHALESRMKKQDERILDMMGRVEVIQLRAAGGRGSVSSIPVGRVEPAQLKTGSSEAPSRSQGVASRGPVTDSDALWKVEERLRKQDERLSDLFDRIESLQTETLGEERRVRAPIVVTQRSSRTPGERPGESTESLLVRMLSERARTSVEIREHFGVSREHAARLLKGLFDRGLVVRNASRKPFVYELTEAGRRYLSAS